MKAPIPIAQPCPADWSQMTGDDRQRLCAQCNKHVHNLSALTPRQLRHFVEKHDGTECIGYLMHTDGSIVTAPHFPWLRRIVRPFRQLYRGAAWMLAALLPSLFAGCASERTPSRLGGAVMVPGTISAPPPKTKTVRGTCDGQMIVGGAPPRPFNYQTPPAQ